MALVFDPAAFEVVLGDDLPYALSVPGVLAGGSSHRASIALPVRQRIWVRHS